MTINLPFLSGQGVLCLRTFADVALLPSAKIAGQICAVDNGTTITLYRVQREGGGLGWVIMADISDIVTIQTNPSDARQTEYSTDGGVTYNPLSYLPAAAVTTEPVSGDNIISGASAVVPLTLQNSSNNSALVASATGHPVIVATQSEGTSDAPAIRLLKSASGNTSPVLEVGIVGGATWSIVNQYGTIEALGTGTLPTPDATWLQSFLYTTAGDGTDGKMYVCIQLADSSYHWVQIAPILPPPPPDPTTGIFPFPALPGIGGGDINFLMIIEAAGCTLPWLVPNHYKLFIPTIYGRWGEIDSGSGAYSFDPAVGGDPSVGGEGWGKIFYQERANQGDTVNIGSGYPSDTELTCSGGQVQILQQQEGTISIGSAQGAFGYCLAIVRVTAPGAYDWIITNDFGGTSPSSGFFGDEIYFDCSFLSGGFYTLLIAVNVSCKATIVDISNYTVGPSSDNTMIAYNATQPYPPNPHDWTAWYGPGTPQADSPAGTSYDNLQIFMILSYGTRATGHLRIDTP